MTRGRALRLAAWGPAALGALAAGVLCSWALARVTEAVAGPQEGSSTSLFSVAFSVVAFGWPPLLVAVPALFLLARSGKPFRLPALAVTLAAGSGLGLMLLGIGNRGAREWLVVWLVFGLLVPRPPIRARPWQRPTI